MKAFIKLNNIEEPLIVRETYETMKRRLRDNQLYIEMTHPQGGKAMLAKSLIAMLAESEVQVQEKKEAENGRTSQVRAGK